MKQLSTLREMERFITPLTEKGTSIGFVPTMGALHEGHLSLIRRAKAENQLTLCSVFVNPIQFNNPEDLDKYPRTLSTDVKMLEKAGCDVLFSPLAEEMYPQGTTESLELDWGMLDKVMEGKFRPGHFKGVAIVVKKLFSLTHPTRAYFGKKDYQQLTVIRSMVKQLRLPVAIIPCDTVREPDGLAMSSRNMRLSIAERQVAPVIYEVLCRVREKAGKMPVKELREWAIRKIQEHPSIRVEYFEIGDKETLMPLENWSLKSRAVAFTAVFLGDVRLIDNLELF